jgi:hypothetical protein
VPRKLLFALVLVALASVIPEAVPEAQAPSGAASSQSTAETRDLNLRAYVELLRADVRGQKAAILTEMMGFTEAEDKAFWPIYREYEMEMAKLNDERLAGIKEYAEHFEQVSDTLADKLVKKALDLESRRTALKGKYYDRFKSALSPKTAARFVQVESQLLMLIDLQIASSLPIVK